MGADLYIEPQYSETKDEEKYYFRDSYNNSSLFWHLGLSWWQYEAIDKNGMISVVRAKRLLDLVKNKPISGPIDHDETPKWKTEGLPYFEKKKKEFIKFLETAIRLKRPIIASV